MENKLVKTVEVLEKIGIKVEQNDYFIKFKLLEKQWKINSIDLGKLDLVNDLVNYILDFFEDNI